MKKTSTYIYRIAGAMVLSVSPFGSPVAKRSEMGRIMEGMKRLIRPYSILMMKW